MKFVEEWDAEPRAIYVCRSRLGCQIEMNEELDGITVRIPSATRNLRVDGKKSDS